ncbi:MAG: hypothetical protein M9921_12140 [Fimbriimonadaceae bacterium]|nr:hypothetical protein [Chthonomonadaceae bacterium]MCO5297596.1 hypothetical protein [Fimbriimonadaceae bacterium]
MNENENATGDQAPKVEAGQASPPGTAPRDWGRIAIIVGFALLLVMLLWQTVAVSRVESSKQEALKKAEQARLVALDEAQKESGLRAARALAAGLHQLFLLRSQYPDLTDRTFQAVCGELAETGGYDLVVITDSNRRILGSSDLTRVGTTYAAPLGSQAAAEKVDQQWEVRAPVLSEDATLGGVVLRLR